jgi:16S rRNA G966 N2-methylase RsmD
LPVREQAAPAIRAIRTNIANLKAHTRCDVRAGSVMALTATKEPLDLVLLDPPYNTGAGQVAIDKLRRLGWIGERHGSRWKRRRPRIRGCVDSSSMQSVKWARQRLRSSVLRKSRKG